MADDFAIATFRAAFPEFASDTKYPSAMLTFWSGIGDKLLDVVRWDDLREQGMSLFVAHRITVAAMNVADVAAGGDPGKSSLPVSSESVGGVSVSFDTSSSTLEGAGDYNETSYGKQFWALANIVGMGGAYV